MDIEGFDARLQGKGVSLDLDHFETIVAYVEELRDWARDQLVKGSFHPDTVKPRTIEEAESGGKSSGDAFGAFHAGANIMRAVAASRIQAVEEAGKLVDHLEGLAKATRAIQQRYKETEQMNSDAWRGFCDILESSTGVAYDPSWPDTYRENLRARISGKGA